MLTILLFSLISFLTGTPQQGSKSGIELIFAGDAMQHQAQLDQALKEGKGERYDYSGCFDLIAPVVIAADYAVCNLEVPLGGGPTYSGYPCFSAPDSYAEALRDAGFDMMLTANNHCLDRGDKAARRTLTALDSLKIDHIGTYRDASERERLVPFIKDIKGYKIGFLNYTYGTNGIEPRDGMEVALIDKEKIAHEIEATRSAGAEIIVVTMHWGIEYVLLENAHQRALADFMAAQGVDLIIGSHPHVVQPMKMTHNKKWNKDILTVYSLGNLISNMNTADTRGGALVKVRIERDENGIPRIVGAYYDTLLSAKPHGEGTNFRVIPSWMTDKIPASQLNYWNIFDSNARRIFNTYNEGVKPLHN